MQILVTLFGIVTTVLAYIVLYFGVYKIFTIASDLSEIKKLLRELACERESLSRTMPDAVLRE